jgi:hypothetical protein
LTNPDLLGVLTLSPLEVAKRWKAQSACLLTVKEMKEYWDPDYEASK